MDPNNPQPNQFGQPQPPYQIPPHPGQPSQVPPPGNNHPNGMYPVGYDHQGQPLYSHPPGQPQMVYLARPPEPIKPPLSDAAKARHAESLRRYPRLNLSDGEYIISAVRRHPIGLLRIWAIAFLLIGALIALFSVLFMQNASSSVEPTFGGEGAFATIGLGVIAVMTILVAVGALVATYVYNNNRFFLTNESVIQEIQTSPFSKHEQTVSLANIEDASFEQHGILPMLLNYGRIRLSTEGDETTYRFSYVAGPKKHVAVLNNAVEAFKNGRPVDTMDED